MRALKFQMPAQIQKWILVSTSNYQSIKMFEALIVCHDADIEILGAGLLHVNQVSAQQDRRFYSHIVTDHILAFVSLNTPGG